MNIYNKIVEKKKANKKSFALLIDPDKQGEMNLVVLLKKQKKPMLTIFS